jgi:HEAT repeat protein
LFKQSHAENQLVKLLNHSNPKVREAAIYAIGNLELMDKDRRLMELYPEELDINKLAILKALQKIPDERQIGFLADITDEGNFDRQFEAVRALHEIGELGKIRLIKIDKERDETFKRIVKHIYDDSI